MTFYHTQYTYRYINDSKIEKVRWTTVSFLYIHEILMIMSELKTTPLYNGCKCIFVTLSIG